MYWRGLPDKLLAVIGLAIVVIELYVLDLSPQHALLLAFGVLLIYVGSWRLTGQLLHKRENRALRGEIHKLIALTRDLYTHRTNGDSARLKETKAALRESLERIITAATYKEDS
jgi:uncharacterized membrane protein